MARAIKTPRELLDNLVRTSEMRLRIRITDADGPQHAKVFTARGELLVRDGLELVATATGTSSKKAKAATAAKLLAQLQTLPS